MITSTHIEVAVTFLFSATLILLLRPLATRVGLIDSPSRRKNHFGEVPLVGGIVIFLSILIGLLFFEDIDQTTFWFIIVTGLMVTIGAIDDLYNLNVRFRILIEMVAASIMVFAADVWVGNLGNLIGLGEVHLPFWASYLFTLVAVFGIINAVNMIDGMDGLAASVALTTLIILQLLSENSATLSKIGPYVTGSLLAFLFFNLRVHRAIPKIFLGDAGSKLIGLTIVWSIIETAQSGSSLHQGISPVTTLFIVGLPLIDMTVTTIRRTRAGNSPFQSDNTHIHHLLSQLGYSKYQSLAIILLLCAGINLVGFVLRNMQMSEAAQFGVFTTLFIIYFVCINFSWGKVRLHTE